jgi:hypothetical protein
MIRQAKESLATAEIRWKHKLSPLRSSAKSNIDKGEVCALRSNVCILKENAHKRKSPTMADALI